MKTYLKPEKDTWPQLCVRASIPAPDLDVVVKEVFDAVKNDGDAAVFRFIEQFDKVDVNSLEVDSASIAESGNLLSEELKKAIRLARKNISKFHTSQKEKIKYIQSTKGITCWRESRAIETVGLYIPGGSAPLFSTVLMLGTPAVIAGCKQIILCTPTDAKGDIHPAILYAASLLGITHIFKVGGIQAIAAMTYGTETIPKVDKIFGPGNQYVTAAKQYAQKFTAIDMPAGPSEVLIVADNTADPGFVAADLLAQAEHGADSQVTLLSNNKKLIDRVLCHVSKQLAGQPRRAIIEKALANSRAITFSTVKECITFSNAYAPEHLILAIKKPQRYTSLVENAGSVFLGNYSCESAGDYASGTNHTLPTNGFARAYSGVSLDSFIKKITFQHISENGLRNIGPAVEAMAEAEKLYAHKYAVTLRLKKR